MEVSTRKYKVEKFYMEDISQMLPKSQYVEEFEPAQNDPVQGAYSLFNFLLAFFLLALKHFSTHCKPSVSHKVKLSAS